MRNELENHNKHKYFHSPSNFIHKIFSFVQCKKFTSSMHLSGTKTNFNYSRSISVRAVPVHLANNVTTWATIIHANAPRDEPAPIAAKSSERWVRIYCPKNLSCFVFICVGWIFYLGKLYTGFWGNFSLFAIIKSGEYEARQRHGYGSSFHKRKCYLKWKFIGCLRCG